MTLAPHWSKCFRSPFSIGRARDVFMRPLPSAPCAEVDERSDGKPPRRRTTLGFVNPTRSGDLLNLWPAPMQ